MTTSSRGLRRITPLSPFNRAILTSKVEKRERTKLAELALKELHLLYMFVQLSGCASE